MALFPPAGIKEDSSNFSMEHEDKGLSSETDGGYVYSRPRHGRLPRRKITTGFTDISDADKIQIEKFAEKYGTYLMFSYTIPDTSETINVRFKTLPKYNYAGVGGTHRYNVTDIELLEV
ncbi:hypothetical protein KW516_19070 [Vibrio fluvialis]|uniref:hypothetical protein n=1 Tax=Vibrio fluvialis TaxID=676 RepID=UPI001C9C8321|nr:hypothetical protein [Vibrio fluvialis]